VNANELSSLKKACCWFTVTARLLSSNWL